MDHKILLGSIEDNILHVEENVIEFLSLNYDEGIKKITIPIRI